LSVLLEALKKAAEDKKKALESSEQSNKVEVSLVQQDISEKNSMPESSVDSEELDSKLQNTLNKPAGIKLSLNESFKESPETIKKPPPLASKAIPDIGLKLDLNLGKTQKIEKPLEPSKTADKELPDSKPHASFKLSLEDSTEQNNVPFDKSVAEETASLKAVQATIAQDNPLNDSTQRNRAISDEPLIEPVIEAVKKVSTVSDSLSDKVKESETVDLHLAKNNLDEISITPELTKSTVDLLKETTLDEVQDVSKSEQVTKSHDVTPLKPELDRNGQPENVASDLKESSIQLDNSSVNPSPPQADKKSLKEDEDSYKWSLDALPVI